MLSVHGLACGAGNRTLFRDLDFSVRAGAVIEVRGPNGVGKTTLLRALAGLGQPLAGTIRWNEEPIANDRLTWNSLMLFQGHGSGWKQQQTVWENLSYQAALDQTQTSQPGAPNTGSVLEHWLKAVGLERQRDLLVGRLSAGQKRRIGLARLGLNLLTRRRVWLLDEPTTALDQAGQALLVELISQHLQSGGLVISATHQSLGLQAANIQPVSLVMRAANAKMPVSSSGLPA